MGIQFNKITKKDSIYQASVAEWSKALVSGTGLFGGVGSNPTTCILIRGISVEDSVAEWSKACDSKSLLLWRRRFKSCHCRFLWYSGYSIVGIVSKVGIVLYCIVLYCG